MLAIFQRLRRQLRFGNRLLGHRRRSFGEAANTEYRKHTDQEEQTARHDQQREPGRDDGRKRRGDRREPKREREHAEERSADEQGDAKPEREQLPLELGGGERKLEPDDRAGFVGDELGCAPKPGLRSPARMGMASPVDPLCERDACSEGCPDGHDRARAAAESGFGREPSCGPDGALGASPGS